ncbi:LLM class flavin-dependent oxidoreductase [Streptomyces canarius]
MTEPTARRLTLGALVHGSGGHIAGWRHPDARPDGQLDFAFHADLARTLERGRFDALFVADVVAIWGHQLDSLSRTGRAEHFEPLTLLAALSLVTEHIGLAATATTTYNHPFHIARKFASLDHISGGRAGWNAVTSAVPLEAANFGYDSHLEHELRYHRAEEFVQVVKALWDSFDDEAVVRDKATGRYYDPTGLHTPHHRGEHFAVRGPLNISRPPQGHPVVAGPLNIARPPQGHPVVVQAGASEAGKNLASRVADVIFSGIRDLGRAQEFYAEIKERAAAHGRDPDHLKVLPALPVVTAPTESEARDKLARLTELLPPQVALADLSYWLGGFDLSACPLDGPLPELPVSNQSHTAQQQIYEDARRDNLTIRDLVRRVANDDRTITGTPRQIADHIEEWFHGRAADGFNVILPYLPGTLDDFAELVIPELRRRGLFRTHYPGRTLRDHLGLPSPSRRA